MAWINPHSHASTSNPSVNGQIVPTLPNIYASITCGDGLMFGVSHCCWRREQLKTCTKFVDNFLTITQKRIFTRCNFKLAKSPNPLNQGTSINLKPQRKSRSTRKFNPQAERESKASNHSMRQKSFPWSVNEAKTRGETSKAKEQIGGKIHSTQQRKTLTRELYSLSLILMFKA